MSRCMQGRSSVGGSRGKPQLQTQLEHDGTETSDSSAGGGPDEGAGACRQKVYTQSPSEYSSQTPVSLPDGPSSVVSSKFYQNLPVERSAESRRTVANSTTELSLAQIGFNTTAIASWSSILQPPKTDLFDLLRSMIFSFDKTNVQIRIAGTTFNCHMLVLQCYSEFFMGLNGEQQIELPVDRVTPQAFLKVYDWMLCAHPLVQRDGILELFSAAQYLKIRSLVTQCWVCLDDEQRFREDAAFLLYLEARSLDQDELIQRLMLSRVSKFFLTLVASREFVEFGTEELCRLLNSNSIGVNSETDVLMSVARWLDFDWPARRAHLLVVMRCVRFSLMAPWQLVELKRNVDVKEIQRFVECAEVQKMVDDALSYVTTKYWYADNVDTVQHYLERLQLKEPQERQWIRDPMWYEHFHASNQMCVSYASFLEYLAMIRARGRDHWRSVSFSESNPNTLLQEPRLAPVSRLDGSLQQEYGLEQVPQLAIDEITLAELERKQQIDALNLSAVTGGMAGGGIIRGRGSTVNDRID